MRVLASLAAALVLTLAAFAQRSRCPIRTFGRTCGPLLDGKVELDGKNRRLELRLRQAFPNGVAIVVTGTRLLSVPIPGTRCFLNTDPAAFFLAGINAKGEAVHTAVVPYQAALSVCVQDVVFRRTASGLEVESSNGVKVGPWLAVRFLEESFDTKAREDRSMSGADWSGGTLKPGRLGGTGVLGEFHASDGRDLRRKDAKGRDIFEWKTDDLVIPASRTLTGKQITVTNGVFEFTKFVVGATEHVRFVGTSPPRIRATGTIRVDGAVELPVAKPPIKNPVDIRRGIPGAKGGLGGAAGGQGGDRPDFSGGRIHGRDGADAVVARGHPRAGQAAGTGGRGSFAHPKSGLGKDLVWIIDTGTKIFVAMTAAGGGGGSLFTQGTAGKAENTVARRPFWPFNPRENGPPAPPGRVFPVLPPVAANASKQLFLLGGAGGGGAGTHPLYTIDERRILWSPGAGGGGGGGVLGLEAGADLVVGAAADILVRGGDSNDNPINNLTPPVHAAGGAGSGGSVLAQCGGTPRLVGTVDVRGGKGGRLFEKQVLFKSSVGGNGGAGYIRVEADPAPPHTSFPKFLPPATKDNAGLLRAIDRDLVTAGASKWVETGFLPSAFHYYELHARVDGKSVVFSDNPLVSATKAAPGQPVVFYIQGGSVVRGQLVGEPTRWFEGELDAMNDSPRRGNGFRFLIRLDRTKTSSGRGKVEIESVRVYFNC